MAEVLSLQAKATTIRDMMMKNKGLIESALPKHMNADRFLRIALTSMSKNPTLFDCTERSLFGAVVQCAQLGLETDDNRGQAYLIPFRNKGVYEVNLWFGYRGLMELVFRTGKVIDIVPLVRPFLCPRSFVAGISVLATPRCPGKLANTRTR